MKALAPALFTLALLAVPIQGHARTWYIRADRNGDAPTIQAAIDSAEVGDDIMVAPGSYDELNQRRGLMGSLFRMKSGVWVHSEGGPDVTFLNGSGLDMVIACYDVDETATIEGFRISYASEYRPAWSSRGGGIYCSNSSPLIIGNRIVDNMGGIVCLSHSSPTITGNAIRNNASTYVGGIYCFFESSPTITYNLIAGNAAGIAGGGVYCDAGCYPVITNNTFYRNNAPGGSGVHVGSSETISRNIFTGHTGGAVLECDVSSAPQISCNNFWDNEALAFLCALGENNVFADPLFCDPGAGDFSLCSFSPCAPGNPMGCGFIGAMGVGCDSCDPPDAVCTVEPPALDFGWVDVGFSKDLDFTISNDGFTSISGSVGGSCEYYSILSGEGEYSLAPGESLTVAVRFEPRRPGTYGCAIDTGDPACSVLSCSGIGRVSGTPNSSGKWALHYAGPHDSKSNTCDFSLEDCDEVVVQGPSGPGRYDVYVVAVDVDRISATRYGLGCDSQFYFYGWTSCSALEIPTAGWPGCGEGNAQTWGQEQYGPHVTVGILDIYVYGVSTLMTSPDPRIGSAEWCDGTQPNPVCRQTSSPEAFGSVGFGRPGYNPSEKVNVTKTSWGKLKALYR